MGRMGEWETKKMCKDTQWKYRNLSKMNPVMYRRNGSVTYGKNG